MTRAEARRPRPAEAQAPGPRENRHPVRTRPPGRRDSRRPGSAPPRFPGVRRPGTGPGTGPDPTTAATTTSAPTSPATSASTSTPTPTSTPPSTTTPTPTPPVPPRPHPGGLPTENIAERLLAVLSGRRPVHYMLGLTSGRAYDELAWLAERGPLRTPQGIRPVLREIGWYEARPGAFEVFARIGAGDRLHAMAFRLEQGADRRWRCTAVDLGAQHRPDQPPAHT
ncbi:Rv3235 family protein [Streptomyces sp. NPDC093252]|uniref:Rv3235 family protein n=1 Tax=Streptomyces sp. NPDC093252 TaxID=3154980 RepID=UPI0034469736